MQTITISIPSEELKNGTAKNQPQQSSSAINKLFEGNTPFVVWLIFFAIGGGILALYYARIGYLPDIEWKAALVYLFIGSIVGSVIGLLLTMSLYLPGVIWSETLIYDPGLNFSYRVPGTDEPGKEPVTELCIRSIVGYLGIPFLLVLLLSHIALFAGKYYWVFAVILLGSTFLVMRFLLENKLINKVSSSQLTQPSSYVCVYVENDWSHVTRKLKDVITRKGDRAKTVTTVDLHTFKLSSWFTLSVFLNQISMYLIYRLSGSPAKKSTFVILTLLCTSGVWIAAHVVALRHRSNARQAVVASLVIAGLLLFSADKFSSLSTKLMNHYGIGEDQQVTLLLTDNGKSIVEALELPKSTACALPKMCNVEIFSKVGNEYFLSVSGKTFTLPKKDVIAIQANDRTRADQD